MIKTIRLPDDTYLKYQDMNPQNAAHAIESQLERFKDLPTKERAVVFDAETRKALEKLYEKPIEGGAAVVEWVRGLIEMDIGGIEITLTASQRKNLLAMAEKFGVDGKTYIESRLKALISREFGL